MLDATNIQVFLFRRAAGGRGTVFIIYLVFLNIGGSLTRAVDYCINCPRYVPYDTGSFFLYGFPSLDAHTDTHTDI